MLVIEVEIPFERVVKENVVTLMPFTSFYFIIYHNLYIHTSYCRCGLWIDTLKFPLIRLWSASSRSQNQ